tara:strand:- start:165 stop:2513 length:2349 start_codon:yes stop_codon:yes gene_type:complete
MRIDKLRMGEAWIKEDDATPQEAKATWDTLEKEFEDNRKMLLASAETDAIIQTIDDKFGPGTMFPASEAPIPEMTDTQRIMEWEERNRKAGGGRIGYGDGGITLVKNKSKNVVGENLRLFNQNKLYHLRLGGDKKNYYGTKEQLTKIFNKRRTAGGAQVVKRTIPQGFVTGEEMLKAAKKKNIFVGTGRDPNNFATVFDFPKTMVKGKNFYDISKLNDEKAVDTILEAQVRSGSATDYAKKKFPVKSAYDHTKKRYVAEKEAGGVKDSGWAGKRGSGVQLGHADDFWYGRKITPQNLLYTPTEINKLLGDKGMIDDKIHAVYEKQEYGKLTKKGEELKKFLNETDATLTRLADQTDGFKQVTLSNNKPYGGGKFSVDMFDEFKGKSQKETIDFVNKWKDKKIITEEMVKNNPDLKVTPLDEVENIKKANFFEINRKAAYDAALKMSQKDKTKIMEKIKEKDFNKQISNYITGKTNKQPMVSSGLAGAYDQLLNDPVMKKLLNSKGYKDFAKLAKTPGKFFGIGDVAFGYLDFLNNTQKGQDTETATKNAISAMTFGGYQGDKRKRIADIKELAVKGGVSPEVFDNITVFNENQNKLVQAITNAKNNWDYYTKKGLTEEANRIEKLGGQIATNFAKNIEDAGKSLRTNLQVQEAGAPIDINVDEQWKQSFENVRSAGIDYRTQQAKEAYDTQKRQVNPGAGEIGNWLLNNIFTLNAREKADLQKQLNDMDEKELYRYNLQRGISPDQPLSGQSTLEFILQNPEIYGSPQSYFDGGIASLRRKK